MAAFNRFLMILIALLAIGAAVLSYMLFERRTEFRDRASLLSETTAEMVASLDKQSGTNVARKVTFTPGDPELGTKESGTLSIFDYHNDRESEFSTFKNNLKAAEELAADVNEQRNYLATTLDDIAYALQIPAAEVNVEDMKNASDEQIYTDPCKKIVNLARATNARTDDMIRTLVSASDTIGHSLEDDMFRSRETTMDENGNTVMGPFKHKNQLEEFQDSVEALQTRTNKYVDVISSAINSLVSEWNWQADADRVGSKLGYDNALENLTTDFRGINEELRRSKEREVAIQSLEKDLDEAKAELSETENERDKLQTKVADQNLIIVDLKKQIIRQQGGRGIVDGQPTIELDPNLRGHIVEINRDWNFVVLDLGEEEVYENLPLLVSRGDQFMGKLFVTKVAKNISVAEIDPAMLKGQLQEGDVVILPNEYGM